jgi:hypothetical protein
MKHDKKKIEEILNMALGKTSAIFMSQECKGTDIVMPSEELVAISNGLLREIHLYAEHMVQQERERICKLITNDNTKQFEGFLVIGTYKEHIIKAINQDNV